MSEEYVKVAESAEVPRGLLKSVTVGSDEICLADVDGEFFAIGNVCTHVGCPLSDGWLDGNVLECSCHGSQFDVTTGQVVRGPATGPEPTYAVKVEDGIIYVRKSG